MSMMVGAAIRRYGMVALTLAGLTATSTYALTALDRQRPPAARAVQLAYLPKGEYLRLATIGFREVAADLIWLKVVQHLGDPRPFRSQWVWAYHAADVVTDLDPKFVMAYLATGTMLGVWGDLTEESLAILKKGMDHNPEVWHFPFFIGYDYFYELCDPRRAAPYIRIASKLPGSPSYLPPLAARMTAESGEFATALEFLDDVDAQVRDPRLHEALAQKKKEVRAEQGIRTIEHAVEQYRNAFHRAPPDVATLVTVNLLEAVPEEPFGGRYEIHDDGSVSATGFAERLKTYRKHPCQLPGRG